MSISGFDPLSPNVSQTIGNVITVTNTNEVAIANEVISHEANTTNAHGIDALIASEADYVTHKANNTNAHGINVVIATANATQSEVFTARGVAANLNARLSGALDPSGNVLLASLQSKWLNNGDIPTYIDSLDFSVPTDRTKVYIAGAIIRLTIGGSYAYAAIASCVYAAGVTTVTLNPNYPVLTSVLSLVEIGLLSFDYAIQNNVATALTNIATLSAQVAALQLPFRKNLCLNGGMVIAQRASQTFNLSNTAQNAQVDAYALWATGTAVSAGTIIQDTAAPVGRKGYAAKVAGATITGTGVVYCRHRIESFDARQFKNQTASFSVRVYHDTGASVNYTIVIRKPSATPDTFGSVTTIGTSAAQAVATATDTLVTFQAVSVGDTSNGIEIEVQAACGAVTTKDFWFTEFKAEEGAISTPYEHKPYADDADECLRRLWILGGGHAYEQIADGQATSTTAAAFPTILAVPMRATPSLTISAAGDFALINASGSTITCTALTLANATPRNVQFGATVASGLVAGSGVILEANNTTNTRLTLSAEL